MNLLLICCVISFVVGVFITRGFYKGKLERRTWERNKAMEYCDRFRDAGERMMDEEDEGRKRTPSSVRDAMLAGAERANRRRQ